MYRQPVRSDSSGILTKFPSSRPESSFQPLSIDRPRKVQPSRNSSSQPEAAGQFNVGLVKAKSIRKIVAMFSLSILVSAVSWARFAERAIALARTAPHGVNVLHHPNGRRNAAALLVKARPATPEGASSPRNEPLMAIVRMAEKRRRTSESNSKPADTGHVEIGEHKLGSLIHNAPRCGKPFRRSASCIDLCQHTTAIRNEGSSSTIRSVAGGFALLPSQSAFPGN